ncbi:complex i intermediate-associated protein 30 [Ophiostoma piceae UAMH 11346]|uniref:Complex i intermediate-associated protein 30 n=1 Tax=Ophiostoma piceae (strain UAMH 11346) TaxID=1262450 RepID=S3C1F0_OPHP1|nr:complex i intermediate-associated protein 30 [Ophiostoma piceae UAMH 11346]
MRSTLIRSGKGFWGRSADELSRLTQIIISSEAIKGPSGPKQLASFKDPDCVEDLKLMTDDEIGGFSTANLQWVPPPAFASTPSSAPAPRAGKSSDKPSTTSSPYITDGYIRFSGNISTQLPPNRPEVTRSGYAAFRTADRKLTIFGRPLWDVDSYAYLAMRVRSDGRSYMVNVQVDSMVAPTDLHQHRLFARRPGQWETIVMPWSGFVRTNHGYVVEPQSELIRTKVSSVGLGLTDRVPGPFEVCVARLWATNNPDEAEEIGPQELKDVEEQAAAESAAAIVSQQQLDSAQSAVSANIPFDSAAPTTTASPPPPSPIAGALKGKDGRPIKWEHDKESS